MPRGPTGGHWPGEGPGMERVRIPPRQQKFSTMTSETLKQYCLAEAEMRCKTQAYRDFMTAKMARHIFYTHFGSHSIALADYEVQRLEDRLRMEAEYAAVKFENL